MRHYLSDEEKLKIKIANLPTVKHEKVELNDRLTFEEARTLFRYKDGNTLNTNLDNLTAGNHSKRIYSNLKKVKTHLNLKGISYNTERKKYRASIQVKGKTYYLGLYESIEIAKKAYNLAVKKLYGDIACFND